MFDKPRRLGSAAILPMRAWALIIESARFWTSAVGNSIRPLRSKKGPPSGRVTLVNRGEPVSLAVKAAVALSACSGVEAETTIAIRPEFCGNSLSNAISRCRHTSFSDKSRSVSVSMLSRLTATQPKPAPAITAKAMTSHAWRLHQPTIPAMSALIDRETSPAGRREFGLGGFDTEPDVPSGKVPVNRQHLPAQTILAGGQAGHLGGDHIRRAVWDNGERIA